MSTEERSSKGYVVFLFCLTTFFLWADQNLLAPNLSQAAAEFGFTSTIAKDQKLGANIAFGFFAIGGPVAVIAGYLTDMTNRITLFGIVVLLATLASFATYFTHTYEQLLCMRVATGIGIGGAVPVIFSVLSDLFPDKHRIKINTLVGVSMSAGVSCGQLLAGTIGPTLGWRMPFLLVSLPAFVCVIVIQLTVRDPKRGDQEESVRLIRKAR